MEGGGSRGGGFLGRREDFQGGRRLSADDVSLSLRSLFVTTAECSSSREARPNVGFLNGRGERYAGDGNAGGHEHGVGIQA